MITLQTNYGAIVIALDFEKAPKTAANFQKYVEDGVLSTVLWFKAAVLTKNLIKKLRAKP
jgi:peptidyl-prolyl cis-trans isomerase B (cyclophilin B)